MSIVEHFRGETILSTLFLPRSRGVWPDSVAVNQPLPFPATHLPWRFIAPMANAALDRSFLKALDDLGPSRGIAYFWPAPSLDLVSAVHDRDFMTTREMINNCVGTAKAILDAAFDRIGLKPAHTITDESIEREKVELSYYDYVFSSNAMVDASLVDAGVAQERIVKTSFGWSPERFEASRNTRPSDTFTVLFAGTIGVRKGVLQLLNAWKASKIRGRLILAGATDSEFAPLLQSFADDETIQVRSYVENLGDLYRSAHVFVFPTFEEGGPQVVYEAAGCGLPIITTPAGAGRLVVDRHNGLIVPPGDVDGLSDALVSIFEDNALRERLAAQAKIDAFDFTYERVGKQRAEALSTLPKRGGQAAAPTANLVS